MESERRFLPKPEKPPVLFHASRNSDITIFEPRAEKVRDGNEGPRVFATPSRAMASVFLVETDDSWANSGAIDGEPYIVISDEARFRDLDKGASIYTLPNATFQNEPDKGLRELEWTSDQPVTPTSKEFIPSALQDMLAHKVKVYFVTKETFEELKDSTDPGEFIRNKLTPL
jgi:hypothetical protein